MHGYLIFVGKRLLQLLAVIFFGVSATFLVTHLSPINPVEAALGRMTARSVSNPEAITAMRAALTELYGVDEPIWNQYVNFWTRLVQGDFGPSLLAFPTPAMSLVMWCLLAAGLIDRPPLSKVMPLPTRATFLRAFRPL